jgi:His-Xaa-Ser system radical SAM maturase HxsC
LEEMCAAIRVLPSDTPHVTITGGEPFLLGEQVFPLLQCAKEHFEKTNFLLLTNGRAFALPGFADRYCDSAPSGMVTGVPIHGHVAQIHDAVTQAPGSFRQTLGGLKKMLALGAAIELRIVVSRLNAPYMQQIAQLIREQLRGADSVKFMAMEMLGNAARNRESLWIAYPAAYQSVKEALRILMRGGINVALYNFPLCAVDAQDHLLCAKSISAYKVRFGEECEACALRTDCAGVFAGTLKLAKTDLRPVRKGMAC